MKVIRSLLLICLSFFRASALVNVECITDAPATVYEAKDPSPQNMDFDTVNNMFTAHSGWYNDLLVHYYKFRIFAPSTYPGVIAPGSSSADVPIQKIYIVTTTGNFTGAVGQPIIQYHTADGLVYSDFMEVNFVDVPDNYTADAFKMESDIMNSNATVTPSGIVLNIPVVPTGATLQHPGKGGTEKAPIDPVPVWYDCVEVWTYVFEVNDQAAADHFAYTRTATDTDDGAGFEITVTPFATSTVVNAIPLWHLNQYSRGVVEGINGGGPSPAGMKNVINLDRPDAGYSPLWAIQWVTELPVDYSADEASNVAVMTSANGFSSVATPMFINCPDVGVVDTATKNPDMKDTFETEIDVTKDSNSLLGSHMTLIFKSDVPVSFQVGNGNEIASTTTNMMGAYEYELMSSDIPDGATEVLVVAQNETIRSIPVTGASVGGTADDTPDNTADGTANGTADGTSDGTSDGTADGSSPSDAGRASLASAMVGIALACFTVVLV